MALLGAIMEGIIKIPRDLRPPRRGRRPKWEGRIGLDLLYVVGYLREHLPGTPDSFLIEKLQECWPKEWGQDQYPDLYQRFCVAKAHWTPIHKIFRELSQKPQALWTPEEHAQVRRVLATVAKAKTSRKFRP
jgi:hypothetical protein